MSFLSLSSSYNLQQDCIPKVRIVKTLHNTSTIVAGTISSVKDKKLKMGINFTLHSGHDKIQFTAAKSPQLYMIIIINLLMTVDEVICNAS